MIKKEKLLKVLTELSGKKGIKMTDKLESLGLDSLAMITMIINLEDAFEVELDEKDMNPYNFETVKDVLNMVDKY